MGDYDRGVALVHIDDAARLSRLCASGSRLDVERMISEVIALDDISEKGFEELLKSSENLKILVRP